MNTAPTPESGLEKTSPGPVSQLSLRAIRGIVAVADRGSFTAAAAQLNVTQPALSRIVRISEHSLKHELFHRRKSGAALSDVGGLLLPRLKQVLWHLETCNAEIEHQLGNRNSRFARHVSEHHLKAIEAISGHSDVGAAAQSLGRTTSLLYRYLRECQSICGGRLFRHERHGAESTALGKIVIRRSKLCFAELRHADIELSGFAGKPVGTLRLGSLPLSRTYLLPHVIAQLKKEYPKLTISLIDAPYLTLLNMLRHGEVDLIIGALRAPAPYADVEEHELFDDELAVVVRRGHPLGKRPQIKIRDLTGFPWAIPRSGTPTHTQIEKLFTKNNLEFPTDLVITSSLVAIRSLLLESNRITVISPHQIHFELELGLLEVLPIELGQPSRPIGYTLSTQLAPPPALRTLINLLRETSSALDPSSIIRNLSVGGSETS